MIHVEMIIGIFELNKTLLRRATPGSNFCTFFNVTTRAFNTAYTTCICGLHCTSRGQCRGGTLSTSQSWLFYPHKCLPTAFKLSCLPWAWALGTGLCLGEGQPSGHFPAWSACRTWALSFPPGSAQTQLSGCCPLLQLLHVADVCPRPSFSVTFLESFCDPQTRLGTSPQPPGLLLHSSRPTCPMLRAQFCSFSAGLHVSQGRVPAVFFVSSPSTRHNRQHAESQLFASRCSTLR